jgi:2-iminobutanoate/2-iminopropanoate deaminase
LRVGGLLFISGQVPVDPETGALVEGDIAAQTRQVLRNIGVLLDAAGLSYADVARTTVFLADMDDFAAMNEAYRAFFTEPYPARSTVQAARLPRDARIEIDAIASYDDRG